MIDVPTDHDSKTVEGAMTSADQFECIDPELGELLALHAEGRLAAADRQLFAAHLKACARCADEERVMREVALGIASLRARPDPAAALDLGTAAHPTCPHRPRRALLIAGAIGVAAALALAFGSWSRSAPRDVAATSIEGLEARIQHLEAQNTLLAHTIASERARRESSPLAGIPIAAPPNL